MENGVYDTIEKGMRNCGKWFYGGSSSLSSPPFSPSREDAVKKTVLNVDDYFSNWFFTSSLLHVLHLVVADVVVVAFLLLLLHSTTSPNL